MNKLADALIQPQAGEIPATIMPGQCEQVASSLLTDAHNAGFQYIEPTQLAGPFWHTTFAPSSSEIIFRLIEDHELNDAPLPDKAVTLQPCLRFVDIAPFSDGRHQPFFHMVTFFWFVPGSLQDMTAALAPVLSSLKALGAPVDGSLFSYFQEPSSIIQSPQYANLFGSKLLSALDVELDCQLPTSGLATYQLNEHRDETGKGYEAWGPRIEIYADQTDAGQSPLEYATFVLEGCRTPLIQEKDYFVLAAAIGIERTAMAVSGISNYWDLPSPRSLSQHIMEFLGFNHNRLILEDDIHHLLEFFHALLAIATLMPEIDPGEKGVRHQLRRIINTTKRKLGHIGILPSAILALLSSSDEVSRLNTEKVAGWLK